MALRSFPRPSRDALQAGMDAATALGGAVAALLASDRSLMPMARAIRDLAGAHDRLVPYIGFVLAVAAALVGVGTALALRAGLDGISRRRLAPVIVLVAVVLLGLRHAPWLAWAAPMTVSANSVSVLPCPAMTAKGTECRDISSIPLIPGFGPRRRALRARNAALSPCRETTAARGGIVRG